MLAHARAAAIVLMLALLSACSGNPAPDAATSTGTPAESADSPSATAAGTDAIFDADDDVLDVAIRDPVTLDPMRIQDPGSVLVARQLYEGLTRWDPVSEKPRPAAAESWEVGEGGRRFTFRLRPGMSFHDGTPVLAQSFVSAFDRIALKANASDLAYVLELVEGFAAANELGQTDHLIGLRAADPLTLVITLSEPYYDFPTLLTHPALVPLPDAALAGSDSFLSTPIGNGPFQMATSWSPGEVVVLRSFPGFIRTPDLDGIRFIPFPDAAASWMRFEEGVLDVAVGKDG